MLYFVAKNPPSVPPGIIASNEILTRYFKKGMPLLFAAPTDPVTIASITNEMILTQQDVNDGMGYFHAHYTNANANFAKDLSVNWNDFEAMVIAREGNYVDSALKFIHRFNSISQQWFLTVQVCSLGTYDPINHHYDCTNTGQYFNINQDGTVTDYDPISEGGLSNDGHGHKYDEIYFQNIQDASGSPLILGTHAQSVTFVWSELEQLFRNNQKATRPNDDLFSLNIASISSKYDISNPATAHAKVDWPHCLCLFLSYDGQQLLDNNFVVGNFYNKAAEYNTICPPKCDVCIWPY